jgi:hypothetical protein
VRQTKTIVITKIFFVNKKLMKVHLISRSQECRQTFWGNPAYKDRSLFVKAGSVLTAKS